MSIPICSKARENTMSIHRLRELLLTFLLFWGVGSPTFAEAADDPRPAAAGRVVPVPVVLANSWGIGSFFSGGGRARVVQVSVVAMCIALYIMMRKFNG
jgi:hypothetical protein